MCALCVCCVLLCCVCACCVGMNVLCPCRCALYVLCVIYVCELCVSCVLCASVCVVCMSVCLCCVCAEGRGSNAGWAQPNLSSSPSKSGSPSATAGLGSRAAVGATDLIVTLLQYKYSQLPLANPSHVPNTAKVENTANLRISSVCCVDRFHFSLGAYRLCVKRLCLPSIPHMSISEPLVFGAIEDQIKLCLI